MMQNLLLQEGDLVRIKNATLPKAKFVEKWTQLMLMAGVDTFSALDELTRHYYR